MAGREEDEVQVLTSLALFLSAHGILPSLLTEGLSSCQPLTALSMESVVWLEGQ